MSLVLMILLGLWLLLIAGLWTSAKMLLQPPRMSAGKAFYLLGRATPDDLNLKYESVEFSIRAADRKDEIKLAGWWIPHSAGGSKTVVLIHGYADAKVGAIAWAPLWQRLGFNVLAYDQRAHGESGGRYSTAGVRERDDLMQVLDTLQQRWAMRSQTIVLFGISLGASPALAVAGQRSDIQAVVGECPFRDYSTAVAGLARQLNLPLASFLPTTLRFAGWISGADLHRVDNLPLIAEARCPLLLIESERDPYVTPQDAEAIRSTVQTRADASLFLLVSNSGHLRAMEIDPVAYERRISDFLESLSAND